MARCDENDSGNACVVVHIQGWTLPVLPLRQPISFFLSFSFLLILRLLLLFPTSSSSSSISSSSSSSSSLSFFLFLFNLLLRPSFFDCSLVDAGWFLSFIEFRTTLVTFFSGWTGFGWSHSTPFLFDFSLFLYYFISFSFILFLWLSLRRLSFGFRLMRLDSSCWNFCWNFFARFPAILQTPSCEEKQQTNTQERTSRLNFFLSLFLSSVRLDPIRTDTILLDRIKISHGGKILLLRDRGSGRKVLHDPWQITNWRWSSIFETVVSRFNPLDLNSMKTWSESLSLSFFLSLSGSWSENVELVTPPSLGQSRQLHRMEGKFEASIRRSSQSMAIGSIWSRQWLAISSITEADCCNQSKGGAQGRMSDGPVIIRSVNGDAVAPECWLIKGFSKPDWIWCPIEWTTAHWSQFQVNLLRGW